MSLSLRLLLIEDSEEDALLLVRELRRGGYDPDFQRVETSKDMEAALHGQSWDVVVSDYTMPQFSVMAALALLKESGLDLPFLVVSGKIGEETAVAMMKAGAHDYIMKNRLTRLVPAIEREIKEAEVRRGRRKAEEALRKSEESYRTLVENSNDAIYVAQDGVIKFANRRMQTLLGYSPAELAQIPFGEHFHPEDREIAMERYQKRLRGEELSLTHSFRMRNKSGGEYWVDFSSVMVDWEGRPASLNFLRDMTEHKKLEVQFLQAQKMEAVGQLAGGFAHDFNNSLTLIKVCSELALLEIGEGDPLKEKIEMIQEASVRSENLARQLLAFSRRQVMEMKVLNLNSLLRDLDKMLRRVIGADIQLVDVLASDLGRVKVDPGQMEQVILNLAVNAKDAMPQGGKLVIETANVELDQAYALDHVSVIPGTYVMLAVSDTGVGMTSKVRERVFEPFFTTKEKGKGTGLGLSTVYGIVKQSRGYIWAYSEPGKGTAFKIYFPRVDEPLGETRKSREAGEVPRGKETVLIVEDTEEVRRLTAEILLRQGYKVLEAANGGEALLVGEKYKGEIHLLLTDVIMPLMSGHELAERLSSHHPTMGVLFMTGFQEYNAREDRLGDKEANYIQKPFSIEGLARKVREALDRRDKKLE